jgi:hypothetical protein
MLLRREVIASLSTLWLARVAHAAEAVAGSLRGSLRRRLQRLDALSRALSHGEIRPVEWQRGAGEVVREIDLAELCAAADFDRVAARLPLLPRGTSAEIVQLLPGQSFTPKIFCLGRGHAIVPHGHRNMVSQHLVLQGEMRGRHYQRLRDEPDQLLVRPTIDRIFRAGDASSISDQQDNVHWFVASSERAYTLDAIVDGIEPSRGYRFLIDFVDPDRAAPAPGGALRLPRIELDEALRRYG